MGQFNIVEILIENSCVQVPSMVYSEWCVEDVIKKPNSKYECYFVIMNKITSKRLYVGFGCIKSLLGTQLGDEIVSIHRAIDDKQRHNESLLHILSM